MRLTITILAVTVCATLVSSLPLPEEDGLHSEALDKLVMVEADNETALRSKRTIGILRQLFPEISQDVNPEAENQVSEVGSESQNNEVRVQFADEQTNDAKASELTPLDDIEANEEDENRNKRFLNFGFGATGGGAAGGGGSGAGSGNFLFDIIRLVAGSGSSASGQAGNSSGGTAPGRTDDTQEAIPGPVTRLFVIANRGISNLIQDLILRLAATSERIVNFKARLITSII